MTTDSGVVPKVTLGGFKFTLKENGHVETSLF